MSNASPLTLFLIRYPVIIFSLFMLIAGLLGPFLAGFPLAILN